MLSTISLTLVLHFRSEDRFQTSRGLGSSYLRSKLSGCEPGEYTSLPSKHSHNHMMHRHADASQHIQTGHKGCRHQRNNGVSTCSADCTNDILWKPTSLTRAQSYGYKSSDHHGVPVDDYHPPEEVKHRTLRKCSSLSSKIGAVSLDAYPSNEICCDDDPNPHCSSRPCNDKFGSSSCSHLSRNSREDVPLQNRKDASLCAASRCPDLTTSRDAQSSLLDSRCEKLETSSPVFDRRKSLDFNALESTKSSLSVEQLYRELVCLVDNFFSNS